MYRSRNYFEHVVHLVHLSLEQLGKNARSRIKQPGELVIV